ncbi:MAG: zinc ribbon domain-containing protein [bacterium]|nr:zinc ribbon domain-containing protein [bacterium]
MAADVIAFVSNSLTITLLVGYIFALWAAIVAWAWIDINTRTDNTFYRLGAVLVVATGAILGFAIYLLLRPNLTKDEEKLREVEEAILSSQSQFLTCPDCYHAVKEDFSYCPNCSRKLVGACTSCSREINNSWNACPYCGTRQREVEIKKPAVQVIPGTVSPGASLKRSSLILFSSLGNLIKKINADKKTNVRVSSKTKSKKTSKATRGKKS